MTCCHLHVLALQVVAQSQAVHLLSNATQSGCNTCLVMRTFQLQGIGCHVCSNPTEGSCPALKGSFTMEGSRRPSLHQKQASS